jgi:hypothetical protein
LLQVHEISCIPASFVRVRQFFPQFQPVQAVCERARYTPFQGQSLQKRWQIGIAEPMSTTLDFDICCEYLKPRRGTSDPEGWCMHVWRHLSNSTKTNLDRSCLHNPMFHADRMRNTRLAVVHLRAHFVLAFACVCDTDVSVYTLIDTQRLMI